MKLLLYCTKAKPYLFKNPTDVINQFIKDYWCADKLDEKPFDEDILNGKIVAECDFEVEEIDFASQRFYENDIEKYNIEINKQNELLKRSCLTATQMVCYLDKKWKGQTNLKGYAIHIKNLNVFDEPREINECYYLTLEKGFLRQIKKAPQNMCYAFTTRDDKDILISIQPQWLCKILNGEKTIEVRKKVLKEML